MHNFVGPLFVVTTLFMDLHLHPQQLAASDDLTWLQARPAACSGARSRRRTASTRARRLVFWGGVLLPGSIVIGSGLFLDKLLPGFVYTRGEMQVAHMIHAGSRRCA